MAVRDLTLAPGQFEGLVRATMQVRLGEHHLNKEEAEDAVSEAWITLAEKADTLEDGPIGGWLRGSARFHALKILERRRRSGETSLEAMTEALESGEDSARVLIDTSSQDAFDPERLELQRDPVLRLRAAAASRGVPMVMATGSRSRLAKLSDEQVEEIRAKRRAGARNMDIAAEFGITAQYVSLLCHHKVRNHPEMEGWTQELVLDALRRWIEQHGWTPVVLDTRGDPTLPNQKVVAFYCGSWNNALRLAGVAEIFEARPPWDEDRIAEAFCSWWRSEQRLPTKHDLGTKGLPSQSMLRRMYGTTRSAHIYAWVRDRCKHACVGCAAGAVTSLDRATLVDLDTNPITSRIKAAAAEGYETRIAPRGQFGPGSKLSDEQVARAKAMRKEGHTYAQIGSELRVTSQWASWICRGKVRNHASTGGWSRELVVEAFQVWAHKHGRRPTPIDSKKGDRSLPNPDTVIKYCGGWAAGLRAAGFDVGDRPEYLDDGIARALCTWERTTGTAATHTDLRERRIPGVPNLRLLKSRTGSQSIREIVEWARNRCTQMCGKCPLVAGGSNEGVAL